VTPKKASGDALTDVQIVEAAREIIEEVGLDGLTMRGLSDRLGVALGATYHHVPTKHDLLVLVGSSLYDSVAYPAGDVSWDEWTRSVVLDLAAVISRYPGLASYLIDNLDTAMPLELNIRMGTMLSEAGFSDRGRDALMVGLTFLISGACAAGVPSRPNPILASIDTAQALEDGIDMLLAGARLQLAHDQHPPGGPG
jgi:AcrR family transcriptional regulator